ncbi:MAG: LysR family transcriptional regulator [Gammaproteobacteria bacterium]|nr:LysR family transcriptional regulator [Gammaproteobacteria bacterium]
MDWDDFKFVQAVARTGSVRGAGELLRVHGSTVVRRLDQLERRLSTRLFVRTPGGMEITTAGAEVIEALDRVAGELEQVERRLSVRGTVPMGPVVLAADAALATEFLIPQLPSLFEAHADVHLVLAVFQALEKLQRGEADMVLMVTDDPPGDLIGRPLGPVMVCAYEATSGRSAMPRWIGSTEAESLSARCRAGYFPDLPAGLVVEDQLLCSRVLETGLGVGLLPCYLGDAHPHLVRAGTMEPEAEGQVWLFTRPDSRGLSNIRVLSTFLQKLFAGHRHRLSGTGQPPEEFP